MVRLETFKEKKRKEKRVKEFEKKKKLDGKEILKKQNDVSILKYRKL